ncbi:MAG TPA: transcription antitermination factor NusB [Edaphocola sp.]|nr:transcription antitermination factor NusB [Edaphocola sp.]
MQALYANEIGRQPEENASEPERSVLVSKEITGQIQKAKKLLHEKIDRSSALFNLLLSYLGEVSYYAQTEARQRAAKYLATAEDKNVSTKLSDNLVIRALWENEAFQEVRERQNINGFIREEWVKKLFRQLAATGAYTEYIEEAGQERSSDKAILKYLWEEVILVNEAFMSDLADEWTNWEDDREMMEILIGNFFSKPGAVKFRHFISEEKSEYAGSLIKTVIEKNDYLLEVIQTKLKNWEAERIAQIDLVLLKMGVSEFLYFPTIPEKVTINEYIDIAKHYSTEQSGQFVNGILDNLRKDLTAENKIRKIDRSK